MRDQVLQFWFDETEPARWWKKDEAFDRVIGLRFGRLHARATMGELYGWRFEPHGRLAEILILDQFSRNIHRDTPLAFAHDGMALALAQEALAAGVERALNPVERSFIYMPFMHSESLLIHDIAVALFRDNGIADNYDFELKHRAVIERFGHYPHRNAILGRASTDEELEFLKQPGSRF